ncbi:serpin-like protein [Leptotrombidium deliense]|uniref:Serpin-like protein n=1 Tax=Leptotrombidium deliense TaxID=299467 RepID=A0A443SWL8_9ACAR|nr:serpin-like protein [Leptotrombidium deliense]
MADDGNGDDEIPPGTAEEIMAIIMAKLGMAPNRRPIATPATVTAKSDANASEVPKTAEVFEYEFVEKQQKFAFEFGNHLLMKNEMVTKNLFYCPYVIFNIMISTLMINKLRSIENWPFLKLPKDWKESEIESKMVSLHKAIIDANRHLIYHAHVNYIDNAVDLSTENGQRLENISKQIGCTISRQNLQENPETLVATIHEDIKRITENRVDQVITQTTIKPNTKFLLANAIQFYGYWSQEFSSFTETSFTTVDNSGAVSTIPVTMMTVKGYFNNHFADEIKCQIVQLPYEASDLSMLVVVPDKERKLAELSVLCDSSTFFEVLANMKKELIEVSIPKFALDTKQFSVPDLQDVELAHNAVIVVDSKGSSVTNESTEIKNALRTRVALTKIEANIPFIFLVIDEMTGIILFYGMLSDPREGLEICAQRDIPENEVNDMLKIAQS